MCWQRCKAIYKSVSDEQGKFGVPTLKVFFRDHLCHDFTTISSTMLQRNLKKVFYLEAVFDNEMK